MSRADQSHGDEKRDPARVVSQSDTSPSSSMPYATVCVEHRGFHVPPSVLLRLQFTGCPLRALLCAASVSTSCIFGTVRFVDSALPFPVISQPPALTPFFPIAARSSIATRSAARFPLPFNENPTATPLFVAFTAKRPLTSFVDILGTG